MKLGKNLETICKSKNLSFARLSKLAEVPLSTLHRWTISGQKAVNLIHLRRVAEALNVSVHELVWGDQDPNQNLNGEFLEEVFEGDGKITIYIKRKTQKGDQL